MPSCSTGLRREAEAYCRRHPGDCKAGLTPSLEGPRDLLVQEVATGKPVATDTAATATGPFDHGNAAGLTLEILRKAGGGRLEKLPSARLHLGDEIVYRVGVARRGHLLIIEVNAEGKVTQLFPNRPAEEAGIRSNRIAAGGTINIPKGVGGLD